MSLLQCTVHATHKVLSTQYSNGLCKKKVFLLSMNFISSVVSLFTASAKTKEVNISL